MLAASPSRREWLRETFLPWLGNWLIVILFFVTALIIDKFVPSVNRRFSLQDITIIYPFVVKETVSNVLLWIIALVVPASILVLLWLKHRNVYHLHNSLLGLLFATGISTLITQIAKTLTGRLRPDFLERCQPGIDYKLTMKLVDISVCSQTNFNILKDGTESFFSGHTSLSFAGLGFLSLCLAYNFGLWRHPFRAYKTLLFLAPLLIAFFIALSRVSDYRHHWEDVLVGLITGLLAAVYSFFQIFTFPPPSSSKSSHNHLPFMTNAYSLQPTRPLSHI